MVHGTLPTTTVPGDLQHIIRSTQMVCTLLCFVMDDDVIKWKHFPRYWPFVGPVNAPHKGQWCGTLMFSLICIWINGWVNNRETGDLRRYHAHYDVTVMGKATTNFTHVPQEYFIDIKAILLLPQYQKWENPWRIWVSKSRESTTNKKSVPEKRVQWNLYKATTKCCGSTAQKTSVHINGIYCIHTNTPGFRFNTSSQVDHQK